MTARRVGDSAVALVMLVVWLYAGGSLAGLGARRGDGDVMLLGLLVLALATGAACVVAVDAWRGRNGT